MTAFNALNGVPPPRVMPISFELYCVKNGIMGWSSATGTQSSNWLPMGPPRTCRSCHACAARRGGHGYDQRHLYADHLETAVDADASLLPLIDEAVSRILHAKAKLGLFDDPYRFGDATREKTVLGSPQHRAVARRSAHRSIVLLRNEGDLLPLRRTAE